MLPVRLRILLHTHLRLKVGSADGVLYLEGPQIWEIFREFA
jgi:hypothetical protein